MQSNLQPLEPPLDPTSAGPGTDLHTREIARGERFEFGKNWRRFLTQLDSSRIALAEQSLRELLDEPLSGKAFLDVGSGSGLFSLAARRMGARVHSFDFDPESVACTKELRRRYFPDDESWSVDTGSVLDDGLIRSLGAFDVVYAWGVLHHTGNLWKALEHVHRLVKPNGRLCVAIYNDTGSQTARWRFIKRLHAKLPPALRAPYAVAVAAPLELRQLLRAMLVGKPYAYVESWTQYEHKRGMSRWRDMVDWVGGYPYETARVDQLFDFFFQRGLELVKLKSARGTGCNEMVFRRRG